MLQKGGREEAVQLCAASEALQKKMGYRGAPCVMERIRKELNLLKISVGEEAFDRNWQRGLYTPPDILVPSVLPKILLRTAF